MAEGYGKYSQKDKIRFYRICKGSAHECGAILDSLNILGIIEEGDYLKGKRLLYEIVCMLVKLCQ